MQKFKGELLFGGTFVLGLMSSLTVIVLLQLQLLMQLLKTNQLRTKTLSNKYHTCTQHRTTVNTCQLNLVISGYVKQSHETVLGVFLGKVQ